MTVQLLVDYSLKLVLWLPYQFIIWTTLEVSISFAQIDVNVHFLLDRSHDGLWVA